jgi:tetratricopeptide (TPR) repeat protein
LLFILFTLLARMQAGSASTDCPAERAMALLDARKAEEARELLAPCAEREPEDPVTAIALARVRLAFADEKGAVRLVERALQKHPRQAELALWLGRAYGQRAIRAPVFEQPSLATHVRKSFERAVALDPENLEARSGLLEYLIRAPKVLGGSPERARDQAEEIQKRDPLKGLHAFGRIAEQEKRWVDADQIYAKAIEEFPGASEPVIWRAALAARLKNWEKAFELLETRASASPGDPRACYEIGRIAAISGGHLDRGEECLKAYLANGPGPEDPPLAEAHLQLAGIYRKKKDPARAKQQYEEALRLDPGLTEARLGLARLR